MKRVLCLAVGLLAQALPHAPAIARQAQWASGFASGNLGSTPNCALVWDDDGAGPHAPSLVLGGSFSTAGGVTVNRIARWSGDNWYAFGTGMSSGTVFALAEFDDDGAGPNPPKLYAGGTFLNAGGVAVQNIARWMGTAWEALPGGGLNSQVNALTVFNGKLYAGGFFTGGCSRYDGAAWTSQPVNGTVNAFCVHNDGSGDGPALYLGGTFTSISGVTGAARIAMWNGTAYTALSSGISGSVNGGSAKVNALASYQGKLIAGGVFNTAGGVTGLKSLAQWDGNGWADFAGGVTLPGTTGVTALYVDPALPTRGNTGGGIWCASDATNYGTNSVACNRLGEFNGTEWSSPGGGVFNQSPTLIQRFGPVTGGPPDGQGGGLFIGNSNTTVGGVYQPNLAVFFNNGYHRIGGGCTGPSLFTQVRSIVDGVRDINDSGIDDLQFGITNNVIQIGGTFEAIGDSPRTNFVRVQCGFERTIHSGDASISLRLPFASAANPPNGPVAAICQQSIDGVSYLGGQFPTLVGGTIANNVCGYNPVTGCFPLANGLSGGFSPAIYSCLTGNFPAGRGVLFSGDYLGNPGPYGALWVYQGNQFRFDASNTMRPDDGPVFSSDIDPTNPDVAYVAGNYDNFGGAQGPYVVQLNTRTGACTSLGVTNPAGGFFINGPATKVVVPDAERQLALGYLAIVLGDMNVPQRGMAARTTSGGWVPPVPNDNLDGGTNCGAIFDDGTPGTWLYVGGFFTKSLVTNTVLNKIAKVNLALPPEQRTFVPVLLNGTTPGFNNNVRCMESAVLDTTGYFGPRPADAPRDTAPPPRVGALLIGGDFTTAGGLSSSRIAAIVGTKQHPPTCIGDVNTDGARNTLDLIKLLQNFGKCPGQSGYTPRCNLDETGACIDTLDLIKLLQNFGQPCPQ